jgi:hypothetical protein
MTDELFEILKQYDFQFRTIRDSNFCRIPGRRALEELNDAYNQLFNSQSKLLNGCSNCIMDGLRRLSEKYFEEVQKRTEPKTVTNCKSDNKKTRKNNKSQINTQNG